MKYPHPCEGLSGHARKLFEEIVRETTVERTKRSKTIDALEDAGLIYVRDLGYGLGDQRGRLSATIDAWAAYDVHLSEQDDEEISEVSLWLAGYRD